MNKKKALEFLDRALDADNKDIKIRVTTMLDYDIVETLKKMALKKRMGYQTLMNQILREVVLEKKNPIKELVKRVAKLEKKIG